MQNYNQRVSKVFEKLHVIQQTVEDEKANRYKMISGMIAGFQQKLEELHEKKQQKFELVVEKMRQISEAIDQLRSQRQKVKNQIQKQLINAQKVCLKILQSNKKQRIQTERRIAFQLNSQLDLLSAQIAKRSTIDPNNGYMDIILEQDIVRLKEDLTLQINKRRQVQQKIFTEFTDQLGRIREQYERERTDREIRQQQVIKYTREISESFKDKISKMKKQRESNESQAVALIQNIIQKLKREMMQLRM